MTKTSISAKSTPLFSSSRIARWRNFTTIITARQVLSPLGPATITIKEVRASLDTLERRKFK